MQPIATQLDRIVGGIIENFRRTTDATRLHDRLDKLAGGGA